MKDAAILLYHRVTDAPLDPFRLCIAPPLFEAQMRYLSDHCTVLSLDQLASAIGADAVPPRAVAVTLDDGYLDNLDVASPILERTGVPATFFVTTSRLEQPHEFWWDTLLRIVLEEPALPETFDLPIEPPLRVCFGTARDRLAALMAMHGRLRRLDARAQDEAVCVVRTRLERRTRPVLRPMVADEVRALAGRRGHSVAAHTVHHLSLPAQGRATQLREMADCRDTLERLLQRRVTQIAYPFGESGDDTAAVAAEAGFTVGVVLDRSANEPTDLLRLPRIDPHRVDRRIDVALARVFGRHS